MFLMPNHILMCFRQNENLKRFREMAVNDQILIFDFKKILSPLLVTSFAGAW